MSNVVTNIDLVKRRIEAAAGRAGRFPGEVTLIAVTKTVEPARIREAVSAGLRDIGENRVQEGKAKKPELPSGLVWHLIGHLQTNKVKAALGTFDLIHSLDRAELANELHRRAVERELPVPVLVEVNVAGEASKRGLAPGETIEFISQVATLDGLRVQGLMTVAPFVEDPEEVRPVFRTLRQLADRVRDEGIPGVDMKYLSMGMSGDFEIAVEEGSNLVRVGSAIFGARPAR